MQKNGYKLLKRWFFGWPNARMRALLVIFVVASFFACTRLTPAYADAATMELRIPSELKVKVKPGDEMGTATDTIVINTNADYGYDLGIRSKDAGSALTSLETTDTIPSISTPVKTIDPTASAWGWRSGAAATDPGSGNFQPAPSTTATDNIDKATTSASNKQYYLTVGATAKSGQTQATYSKTFVITATANLKPFSISYNTKGGNGTVTGSSGNTSTTKISFKTPAKTSTSKDYFELVGWCAVDTTSIDVEPFTDSCPSDKKYGLDDANASINRPSTETGAITLYAIWKETGVRQFSDLGGSMQRWGEISEIERTRVLKRLGVGEQKELKDTRDQRMYYVAKLPDGNLWMTENLDLKLSKDTPLKASDTDLEFGKAGVTTWTPERSTLATNEASGWSNQYNYPYSYDPGDRCWNGTITSTNYAISNDAVASNCTPHHSDHWHVGNYYNWSAAVAMNDTSAYTTNQEDVNQSICPRGWRLPTYDGEKSFANLKTKVDALANAGGKLYNGDTAKTLTSGSEGTIHLFPYYFPYSGFYNGIPKGTSYVGYFWSGIVYSTTYAYSLDFYYTSGLYSQNGSDYYFGFSIRCVAR